MEQMRRVLDHANAKIQPNESPRIGNEERYWMGVEDCKARLRFLTCENKEYNTSETTKNENMKGLASLWRVRRGMRGTAGSRTHLFMHV